MGDVIYLIRFPLMDADKFITTVGKSRVLTSDESLNIILSMKDSLPKHQLPFSSVTRSGVWTTQFFNNTNIRRFPPDPGMSQAWGTQFNVQMAISVHSIYVVSFCPDPEKLKFHLLCGNQSINGKHVISHDETFGNCTLYEVIFEPPVCLFPGTHTLNLQFMFMAAASAYNIPLIRGSNTLHVPNNEDDDIPLIRGSNTFHVPIIEDDDISLIRGLKTLRNEDDDHRAIISIPGHQWQSVVGFKFKSLTHEVLHTRSAFE